jgi:hypothetical protein
MVLRIVKDKILWHQLFSGYLPMQEQDLPFCIKPIEFLDCGKCFKLCGGFNTI